MLNPYNDVSPQTCMTSVNTINFPFFAVLPAPLGGASSDYLSTKKLMSKFTNVGNRLDRLEVDPLDLKQILANDLVKEDFGNMDESLAALPENKYINNNDIDNVTAGSFRSIFWNCRGLMSKMDFLSAFLPSHDILLIGVCETFLSDNLSSSVLIQGYNFLEKSRVSKNKGGIGCYIRNDIHSRKITDFDDLY